MKHLILITLVLLAFWGKSQTGCNPISPSQDPNAPANIHRLYGTEFYYVIYYDSLTTPPTFWGKYAILSDESTPQTTQSPQFYDYFYNAVGYEVSENGWNCLTHTIDSLGLEPRF